MNRPGKWYNFHRKGTGRHTVPCIKQPPLRNRYASRSRLLPTNTSPNSSGSTNIMAEGQPPMQAWHTTSAHYSRRTLHPPTGQTPGLPTSKPTTSSHYAVNSSRSGASARSTTTTPGLTNGAPSEPSTLTYSLSTFYIPCSPSPHTS